MSLELFSIIPGRFFNTLTDHIKLSTIFSSHFTYYYTYACPYAIAFFLLEKKMLLSAYGMFIFWLCGENVIVCGVEEKSYVHNSVCRNSKVRTLPTRQAL